MDRGREDTPDDKHSLAAVPPVAEHIAHWYRPVADERRKHIAAARPLCMERPAIATDGCDRRGAGYRHPQCATPGIAGGGAGAAFGSRDV